MLMNLQWPYNGIDKHHDNQLVARTLVLWCEIGPICKWLFFRLGAQKYTSLSCSQPLFLQVGLELFACSKNISLHATISYEAGRFYISFYNLWLIDYVGLRLADSQWVHVCSPLAFTLSPTITVARETLVGNVRAAKGPGTLHVCSWMKINSYAAVNYICYIERSSNWFPWSVSIVSDTKKMGIRQFSECHYREYSP